MKESELRTIVEKVVQIIASESARPTSLRNANKPLIVAEHAARKRDSAADKKWGYPFGIDGLMSLTQAQEYLGGMSRSSIERHVAANRIRKGRSGRVYFCKRSILAFATSIEK